MKKVFNLPKKRAILSMILVCAMLVGVFFGTGAVSVSALTQPTETVDTWNMTSDLETVGFAQQWYAMVNDPVDADNGLVLGVNARSNQHNHASLGRPMVFNDGVAEDGTYNLVALKAGKYTVSFKYYLKTVEEGFYAPKDASGNSVVCETCNTDIKAYNDGTSASNYEIYFGVVSNTDGGYDIATSKLVSKSNALFSYETAKNVNFEKYGWQNGKVSFVVTEEMVANDSNIFAMYRKAIGHAVYLKDISVTPYSETGDAADYGLISDFSKTDTLPATDSTSFSAAAMSVNNSTNAVATKYITAADLTDENVGTQNAMAITLNSARTGMPFNTGFAAMDYMTLKSDTEYQISFDFYNPNYANYASTWSPTLKLTNLSTEGSSTIATADRTGIVELLNKNDINSDVASKGYIRISKNFTVSADTTINRLAFYSTCIGYATGDATLVYYIDNIQLVEVNNTAIFDFGNRTVKTDNITVTYGDNFTAPVNDATISKAGNISGWNNLTTGEFVALGEVVSKEKAAKYIGESTVFVAEYNNAITFDFNNNISSNGNLPSNISGTVAKLVEEEANKYIEFTQIGADRHFLLYSQDNSDTVTALASYEKFKTYKITFDYNCTEFGTSKPKIYAAMGVQYYTGSTKNAIYKANIVDITATIDGWQTATAYVMAPNGYEVNTAEGAVAFQDGKYIALGVTGLLEGETPAKVLFDNVTVEPATFTMGDLSNNAIINATDLSYLRSYLLGSKEITDTAVADINFNGTVDIVDLVRLKKYLAIA